MRIGYVNIFVADLKRSIGFFHDLLGLKLNLVHEDAGYASLDANGFPLGLALAPDLAGEDRHTGIGFCVTDLDAEYERLRSAGVEFPMPPTRQPWGGYMALFADPDGNLFYLDEPSAVHGDGAEGSE